MFWLHRLTGEGKAGVFLSYPPQLGVQEEAEVDALGQGGEGEEARRDSNRDLWLIAAEAQLIQSLLRILRTHLQDLWYADMRM